MKKYLLAAICLLFLTSEAHALNLSRVKTWASSEILTAADLKGILDAQREETTLAYLYELLSRQPKGESGVLLTNGYATIFYIKDANGKLWAVRVYWRSYYGEWCVGADSVAYPDEWHGGYRVFSRK